MKIQRDKEESSNRRVDALLIERSRNKTLTSIFEAKKVEPYVTEEITEGNISRIKNALEEAKAQLLKIKPQDIYLDEQKGVESHVYRIALIFIVLRAKFAKSGEDESLEWYDTKDVLSRAKEYFREVDKEIDEEHIANYYEYIHSRQQLGFIKDYFGITMVDKGREVDRTHLYTYYNVGVKVIAALFK